MAEKCLVALKPEIVLKIIPKQIVLYLKLGEGPLQYSTDVVTGKLDVDGKNFRKDILFEQCEGCIYVFCQRILCTGGTP